MNKDQMLKAIQLLDSRLKNSINLLLGGGGAMLLAYGFPLATHDLDAVIYKSVIKESDIYDDIIAVANELQIPKDWLNPYFETFLYTLPKDYESRLNTIFTGKNITVNALSMEDLLVLKCFAGREKDIGHSRALIKKGTDTEFVRRHIHDLIDAQIPKAQQAVDFLDDLLDQMDP